MYTVKVRVDPERCVGHGRCYALGADVFVPDDFGHSEVIVAGGRRRRRRPRPARRGELPGAGDHGRAVGEADVPDGRTRLRRQAGDRHRRGIGHGRRDRANPRRARRRGARDRPRQARAVGPRELHRVRPARSRRRSKRRSSASASVVNMLFNCAGVPNTFPDLDVMLVNFCGLRHLTERVVPKMLEHADSAIATIASTAGIGWLQNMELLGATARHRRLRRRARRGATPHPCRLERTRTASRRKRSTRTPRSVRSRSRRRASASTA